MKILIAYDGSECSDAAIVDLRRAGLPAVADAVVMSVAETSALAVAADAGTFGAGGAAAEAANRVDVWEARTLAALAAERLAADFPGWHIRTEAWADASEAAIVRTAHAWEPDLIVMGSHGRAGVRRIVLGSVSEYVLHHVSCSVRVSRHRLHSQKRPIRLLIGVDGSNDAKAAVRVVAGRNWPAGTEARVVAVVDPSYPATAVENATPVTMVEEEVSHRMARAAREGAGALSGCGLRATDQVFAGKPGEVLLTEAERWGADCVFVGARGLNGLERLLLGSVSTAVASRAHCSVEVVRPGVA